MLSTCSALRRLAASAVLLCVTAASSTSAQGGQPAGAVLYAAAAESYSFVLAWDNAPAPGTFNEPNSVAVDSHGDVYVADARNARIQKFTAAGTFIRQWGSKGNGQGQFLMPVAVAVDGQDNVYVRDGDWMHVQKFGPDGTFLSRFSAYTASPYRSVAVDSSGNVYVVGGCCGSGKVHKYSPSGQMLKSWEGGDYGLAVFGTLIYALDRWHNIINKFDLNGNLVASWPAGGAEPGLAVDQAGNVYAASSVGYILKFDPDGRLLARFGQTSGEYGSVTGGEGLAVAADGSIYVADAYNHHVQRYSADGRLLNQWGTRSASYTLRHPEGVAVSRNGTVFVADTETGAVQAFTDGGAYLTAWGTWDYPGGIAAADDGSVFVSGPAVPHLGSRTVTACGAIHHYSASGTLLQRWSSCGSGDGQVGWPTGLAVGPDGSIYVADTENNRIQKFSPGGTFVAKWGREGSGNGQFYWPQGVAVGPDGSIYVADTVNHRIQRFSPSGAFLSLWGGYGTGNGQFRAPRGIAVDSRGFVFVADADNDRVQQFTAAGAFVGKWGGYGKGDGQFDTPLGIAVDAAGYVYVADAGNNRIQKFQRQGPDLSGSSKQVSHPGAAAGNVLTYTVVVRNTGNQNATLVLVTDTLPSALSYAAGSLSATGGSCRENGSVLTWTGAVSLSVPVTITLRASVKTGLSKGALVTNTVAIDDGSGPVLQRWARTIVDPYLVCLPVIARGWLQ